MSVAYPVERPVPPSPRIAGHVGLSGRAEAPLVVLSSGLLLAGPHGLLLPGFLLAVLAWLSCGPRWLARRSPLDAGWLLLLAGSSIGFLAAPIPAAAEGRLAAVVAALTLFFCLQGRIRSVGALRLAAGGLVVVAGIGALVILALIRGQLPSSLLTRLLGPVLGLFAIFPGISGDVLEINSRFPVHQYGLAYLLLVIIPFLVAEAVLGTDLYRRLTAGVWALGLMTLLAATEARGALLALALATALVAGLRSRWFWLLLPLGTLAVYGLLARGIISRSIEGAWLETRLSIWSRSLYLLADYPLSGVGLGMQTFAEVFAWNFGLSNPYMVVHSHNVFIQAYAEQGLFGLVGLLFVLVGGLLFAWSAARSATGPVRPAAAGVLGALLGSVLYGLTDQVPTTNDGLAVLAVLCALAVAGSRLGQEGTCPARPAAEREGVVERARARANGGRASAFRLTCLLPVLAAGVLLVGAAPRWASGLALNVGATQLAAAALNRGLDVEQRGAALGRAEGALSAAVAWNAHNVGAYRELARVRLLRHDVPGALAALGGASAVGALNNYERTQLGRLYLEMGFWQQAFGLWQAAGQSGLLRQAADDLAARGDFKGASAAHGALVELNPDVPENYSNLAKAVLAGPTPDVNEAMRWFDRAAELKPEARRSLARQLVLQGEDYRTNERRGGGRPELAAFWFGLASQVDPSYDRPEVELGAVLYYAGRYAEAAEHFRTALARDPQNGSTWHQLGQAEEAAGRVPEAAAAFEQGVRVAPSRAGLRASLGRMYLRLGRCEAADRELGAALRLEPDNAVAQAEQARLGDCR